MRHETNLKQDGFFLVRCKKISFSGINHRQTDKMETFCSLRFIGFITQLWCSYCLPAEQLRPCWCTFLCNYDNQQVFCIVSHAGSLRLAHVSSVWVTNEQEVLRNQSFGIAKILRWAAPSLAVNTWEWCVQTPADFCARPDVAVCFEHFSMNNHDLNLCISGDFCMQTCFSFTIVDLMHVCYIWWSEQCYFRVWI